MEAKTVLAVDGGGTKLRAVLSDHHGKILAYAEGDSGNYHSIGAAQAAENVKGLLRRLFVSGAIKRISYSALALAGVDTPEDYAIMEPLVAASLAEFQMPPSSFVLDNDAILALKGASGKQHGVLLIAGTGSIACGIHQDGRTVRAGGWGYRVGDEGSGFAMGTAGLVHILRAADGREPRSAISNTLLQQLGLVDETHLAAWIYSDHYSVAKVAALAPSILDLAYKNEKKALAIVQSAARELQLLVQSVVTRLELERVSFSLLLKGGLMDNSFFQQMVQKAILEQYPQAKPRAIQEEPLAFILAYAFEQAFGCVKADRRQLVRKLDQNIKTFRC
ncbi:MAG: BadF/BadG/BcrA/BcrD ATPase family protein [Sporomusaceae bacterium]|nr:BadF/BadG/BcrA/BcrD ATPase family protein [Sporomusaceae bacterium]